MEEKVIRLAHKLDREAVTPGKVRKILDLKGKDRANFRG